MVVRYNMYPSTAINGNAAPGVSSGQALTEMERVARQELPATMRPEWTELGLLQLQTGNTAMLVFVPAIGLALPDVLLFGIRHVSLSIRTGLPLLALAGFAT